MSNAPEYTHGVRYEQKIVQSLGPGTYEEHRNFGDDKRKLTFGEKRESPIRRTVGPGEYQIE